MERYWPFHPGLPHICKTIDHGAYHARGHSSFDGINLYKGNNEFVEALYPEVHTNALDYAGLTDPPRDIQDKEWTVNDHFRQLALRYLSSDWWHALRWFKTFRIFRHNLPRANYRAGEPISVDQLRDLATLRNEKTLKVHVLAIGYGLYKGLFIAFHRPGRVACLS